jgi:PAS domain S-box-containing protein
LKALILASDPTLQLVLETALDAVLVMGSDGTVMGWNQHAESIFGWTAAEVMGAEMATIIIPPRHREAHRLGLARYLSTGEGPVLRKRIEITALRKDGSEFPIELSITPVAREDQVFLGFIRDITERRTAELRLARQIKEALLLHHLTSLAAESPSLDGILQNCLESVRDLLDWPLGHAYLVDTGAKALTGSIWSGDIDSFPTLRAATDATEFVRGVGLPGKVWDQATPMWISSITRNEAYVRTRFGDLGVRAAFGFPIVTAGEVVAVLEFFGLETADRDERILATARAMGDQIGRVLERNVVQDRQSLLLAELEHRSKNMLAIVMGIASQTARGALSVEAFTGKYLGRLTSLSRAYSLLTASNWQAASLSALVEEVITPHLSTAAEQLMLTGPQVILPAQAALTVSMMLHELTTNAAKYGALKTGGRIHIETSISTAPDNTEMVKLVWFESGVTGMKPKTRSGFGSKLIETSIRHELKGTMQATFEPQGVRYEFVFPVLRQETAL